MPKETTYGRWLPYGDDSPARAVAEVLWARDAEYVQVVTRCVHAADEQAFVPTAEAVTAPLTTSDFVGDKAPPEQLTFRDGFYVDLDRTGINKVIRDLRRARDQAFGRDE